MNLHVLLNDLVVCPDDSHLLLKDIFDSSGIWGGGSSRLSHGNPFEARKPPVNRIEWTLTRPTESGKITPVGVDCNHKEYCRIFYNIFLVIPYCYT
jgi:hypothetical protein